MSIKPKYDVVIVGAGPVGTAMANLLGTYGVSTLVIDKESEIIEIPRAIGLCEEGSRVLSAAGVLDAFSPDTLKINKIRMDEPYGTSMAHTDPSVTINGYPSMRTFYQPAMERCLRKCLEQYDHVDLSVATECTEFRDEGDQVKVVLAKADQKIEVACSFMIASDGSTSPTRKKLNIGFDGKTYGEDWIVFDAENNPEPNDQVALLCNRERPGITMSAPNGRRRWEFIVREDDDREAILEDKSIAELLKPWGDVRDMALTRKTIYTFHARMADRFREGNVFLIGDAAHITPPFAGQGLMAGFRDCYNLAWKIRDVLNGRANTDLLATYDTERMPQVKQIIWFAKFIGSSLLPASRWRSFLRDLILKTGRATGAHSDTKPLPIRKLSNHINGKWPRHSLIRKFRKTGFEMPQTTVEGANGETKLLDRFLGDSHYLVAFNQDPSDRLSESLMARWKSAGGHSLNLSIEGGNAPVDRACLTLTDHSGEYQELLNGGTQFLVVRPDKMIMVNCKAGQLETRLNHYLSQIETA